MTVPGNLSSPLLATAAAGAAAGYAIDRSLRFSSGDSAYLSRTPSSSSNRKTFTWSGWLKKSTITSNTTFFSAGSDGSNRAHFMFDGTNHTLRFFDLPTSTGIVTTQVFRDTSAWYHLVLSADTTQSTASNRIKIYVNGAQVTSFSSSGYPAQNADLQVNKNVEHRLGSGNTYPEYFNGYLADVQFVDGQALAATDFGKTDSSGIWQPKAYEGSYGTNGFHLKFADNSTAAALGTDSSGNSNTWTVNNLTVVETATNSGHSSSTLSNNTLTWSSTTANTPVTYSNSTIPRDKKTYIEVVNTAFGGNNPGPGIINVQNTTLGLVGNYIGAFFRHGQATETGVLGSFTGSYTTWTTSDVLGIAFDNTANSGAGSITFYKNGSVIQTGGSGWTSYNLYVVWSNNGTNNSGGTWNYGDTSFSYPVSGHTGFVVAAGVNQDSLVDTPEQRTGQTDDGVGGNVVANYATLNPLDNGGVDLSNGNLDVSNGAAHEAVRSTIKLPTSGKWYAEATHLTNIGGSNFSFGVDTSNASAPADWNDSGKIYISTSSSGRRFKQDTTESTIDTASHTGDVLQVAYDADNQKLYLGINNTWYNSSLGTNGDPSAGSNPTRTSISNGFLALSVYNATGSFNAGQRPFSFTAPTNFLALNTANLPTPTIADGSQYFDTKLYTGNGGTQSISSLSFSPDFIWFKSRNTSAFHTLIDSVRGGGNFIRSNETSAETTGQTDLVTSFNSNGFTMGANANSGDINQSGRTYVAWTWDAGANSNKTYAVKVVSDGGNKYRFDDHGTSAVTLELAEGSTYVFDQSDSSNSGHPLRFSTTSNGTHGGGSEYTTGVTVTGTPGNAGAKTTIALPPAVTWSSHIVATASGFQSGYGADKMFDGNTSTYGQGNSGTNPSTLVFTPPSPIVFGDKVEIWHVTGDSTLSAGINGGSKSAITNGSWQTVASGGGTLTTLDISRSTSGGASLAGVRIDGVVLQDGVGAPTLYYYCTQHSGMGGQANTNSTAGSSLLSNSLASSAYNQTNWTGSTTTSNIATNTGNDLASVFDGNLSNGTRAANNGGTGTLQWSSGTIQGNVRVYTSISGTQGLTYYNGSTSTTIASANNGWNDLGNIDLTRLDFVYSGGNITFVNAIELDGKLLVQTGVTLANVPSITSTVRASQASGFSIVAYTGTGSAGTVGHGLNAAPKFIITKRRDSSGNWYSQHASLGASHRIQLDQTSAATSGTSLWNSTSPTNSVFSIGGDTEVNASGGTFLALCFAPVAGYSAMGSYTGSSSFPFIHCGFRPAFIILKKYDGSDKWCMYDTARGSFNTLQTQLHPNTSDAESGDYFKLDILSNGFRPMDTSGQVNENGKNYIFIAFAENPFSLARAR